MSLVHHVEMHALRTNNAGGRATTRSKISNGTRLLQRIDGRTTNARVALRSTIPSNREFGRQVRARFDIDGQQACDFSG